ncbi:MAG TPA: hypothetical protein VF008_00975 [Niastella sp.]
MRKKFFQLAICLLSVAGSFAQQWSGSNTTSGLITREGITYINSESSGLIVDAAGLQRSGFMKYWGKYAGLWRDPEAFFEIGRVTGNILSPTGFTTDMFFAGNGNIGIGTLSPGTFKLAVEGKIGAREVRVTSANPWPDYVFAEQYKLISLSALKEYISRNHRLPEMPSAQEVKDNGIELGKMNAKLLEKIEELTLYVIELKEDIEQLKKNGGN